MKMNHIKRSLAVILALLMILVSVPAVSATESADSSVPGSILVSVQTGSPRSISGARNTVIDDLADFEMESIGMLASTETNAVFRVDLVDKTLETGLLAIATLEKDADVISAKPYCGEYSLYEADGFEPGRVIVSGDYGNLLKDFEIESIRLLTPGSDYSAYLIVFKEKTKDIVWKALEILENCPSIEYACPSFYRYIQEEPYDPTEVLTELPTESEQPSIIKGDADGDGYVSITDATTIQRYLVGLFELDDEQVLAADTDGDGYLSITDVTMIQRYLVGLVNNW